MSTEENKALVCRYFEESSDVKGDPNTVRAIAGEFLAPEFVAHHSYAGDMNSEQYTTFYEVFFTASPQDLKEFLATP